MAIASIMVKKGGGYNSISVAEWTKISLTERLGHIKNHTVSFLDATGTEVPASKALEMLRSSV